MRSPFEIKTLLLGRANKDDRVRAVLLNGSRANPHIETDIYQDFDITFIVDDLQSFITDHSWTWVFGEKLIFQLPDEMINSKASEKVSFTYLMLFKDHNRIDLTLFPVQKLSSHFKSDSLTIVWLDKDNLFADAGESNNSDYLLQQPTQKEYSDTCNEFWWVSTYVVKALLRGQIIYAKEMLETVVRPMFMQLIGWKTGLEYNYTISLGKAYSQLKRYVTSDFYNELLFTYSGPETEDNWKALFKMTEIFQQTSDFVARELFFSRNTEEEQNVIAYIKKQYNSQRTNP